MARLAFAAVRVSPAAAAILANQAEILSKADGGTRFAVRYADPGYARLGRIVEREKQCVTKSAALKFCVLLRHLGGRPIELLQSAPGEPDTVLAGQDLDEVIGRLQTV